MIIEPAFTASSKAFDITNSMNAVAPIIAANEALSAEDQGDLFRGKALSRCAHIEWWTSEILRAHSQPVKSKDCLGLKLGSLRALAEQTPSPLGSAPKLVKLLDELAKITSFRNELAHARLSIAKCGADRLFVFTPCEAPADAGWRALVLSQADQREAMKRLSNLQNRLKQLAQAKSGAPNPS